MRSGWWRRTSTPTSTPPTRTCSTSRCRHPRPMTAHKMPRHLTRPPILSPILIMDVAAVAVAARARQAMHWAALGGHAGAVTLLASLGADPEARDVLGSAPLHYAADAGRAAAVRALLAAGARPALVNCFGRTALHWAEDRFPEGVAGPEWAVGPARPGVQLPLAGPPDGLERPEGGERGGVGDLAGEPDGSDGADDIFGGGGGGDSEIRSEDMSDSGPARWGPDGAAGGAGGPALTEGQWESVVTLRRHLGLPYPHALAQYRRAAAAHPAPAPPAPAAGRDSRRRA
jgi:hypothetical protein